MAMSDQGQNLQPLTGNSDVFICVKNAPVWQQNKTIEPLG